MRFGGSEMMGGGRKGDARQCPMYIFRVILRVALERMVYFGRLSKHVWLNVKHVGTQQTRKNKYIFGAEAEINVLEVTG